MDRLQSAVERVGIRGREGLEDHADEDMAARRAHVQQVIWGRYGVPHTWVTKNMGHPKYGTPQIWRITRGGSIKLILGRGGEFPIMRLIL
jgi:hypothetical protein